VIPGNSKPALFAADPSPLAENVQLAGFLHDVLHREEVRLVLQLRDQLQLLGHLGTDFRRHAVRVSLIGPGPGELGQVIRVGLAGGDELFGILVLQFFHAELTPSCDLQALPDGLRVVREQLLHLSR